MQKKQTNQSVRLALRRICFCGAMVALSIIFCRLLGFPQTGIWRVEIGFLPIAFIAVLWGPVWSGLSYGAADLIGAAIFTGINPFITLEKILTGAVMGVCFHHRRKIGVTRMVIAFATIAVLLDFLMMAAIFHAYFGYTWGAAFAYRGVNAGVNFAMRGAIMLLLDLRLTGVLTKWEEKLSA